MLDIKILWYSSAKDEFEDITEELITSEHLKDWTDFLILVLEGKTMSYRTPYTCKEIKGGYSIKEAKGLSAYKIMATREQLEQVVSYLILKGV